MSNLTRPALLILSAALASGANAIETVVIGPSYGTVPPEGTPARAIPIVPSTKYINVTDGETVKITAGDKNFSRSINTPFNVTSFKLEKIVPPEFPARGVDVYVAPDPLYSQ